MTGVRRMCGRISFSHAAIFCGVTIRPDASIAASTPAGDCAGYICDSGVAKDLPEGKAESIQHLCKRAFRALELSGYARIDLRLDDSGNVWVLEANPNPQIARGEDFAASAEKIGLSYETVLQRILAVRSQLRAR